MVMRGDWATAPRRAVRKPRDVGTIPAPKQRQPGPLNGGTIPAPAQRAPTPYTPPPGNYYNLPSPYTPPVNNWGGGGGGDVIKPTPPPKPPKPQKSKAQLQKEWLKGDTDYQEQISGYGRDLKDFLTRLGTRKSDFETDYKTAMAGLARNQTTGLNSLGEDFSARGLAYSGLFAGDGGAKDEAEAGYKRQGSNIQTSRDRGLGELKREEQEKTKATEQAKRNAERDSLRRFTMENGFN